jgi:hypothetical protein
VVPSQSIPIERAVALGSTCWLWHLWSGMVSEAPPIDRVTFPTSPHDPDPKAGVRSWMPLTLLS